jgi:long-chain acyl-CoA synthetase
MENITRLFDIPYYQLEKYPNDDCLAGKENGAWKKYSTKEYLELANSFSRGLISLGIQPGDKVALISNNRPEWNIADIGILQVGAIGVPVYPTISENDYKFIFNDAEVKLCVVSDKELYDKVASVKHEIPSLREIYTFNTIPGHPHWTEIVKAGANTPQDEVETRKANVKEEDLATLIYTSGTTGLPKGVMLSHKNIVSNAKACINRLPCDETSIALSFLPICHVYERMLLYLYQLRGVSIYFAESLETIKDNIVEVRPHVFTAVPRLLEKVYDGIVTKGTEAGGIKAAIFRWALKLTEKYEYGKAPNFSRRIADKLVYSKIRAKLGGRILAVASGSAALQPRLARFFNAIGIPTFEGYGLTETSPVVSVNAALTGVKFGSVGKVLDGVSVKIAEDGEILTKGPNLMMGYYKRPDLTSEVIDNEGWFHTGDIGELDGEGYLRITDRKKEIFKTSGGKYVAPQPIENKLKESRFIEQAMVIGENQKFPAAFIVPSFAFVREWAKIKGINLPEANSELIKNEEVIARIGQEIEECNASLGQWEKLKKFELLSAEWGVPTGELTPTLKLKRKVIMSMYANQFNKIYAD